MQEISGVWLCKISGVWLHSIQAMQAMETRLWRHNWCKHVSNANMNEFGRIWKSLYVNTPLRLVFT